MKDLFGHLNQNIQFKGESDRRQRWRTKSWMIVLELRGRHMGTEGPSQMLGGRDVLEKEEVTAKG